MLQAIINLLIPILQPMGVSEADITSYVNMCGTQVKALVIATIVMLVLLIAAHWLGKKGSRHVIRWTAVLAWLASILIIANTVIMGPLKDIASSFFAPKVELNEETVLGSKEIITRIGEEGMVLLKNEDALLPLSGDVKNINVFGWDSTNPLFGGTGSGSSDGSSAVGILQSLKDAGYATNETLTKLYTDYRADRPTIAMQTQDWTLPEPTMDYYTDAILSEAKSFSDVAMIVIGRSGGEGADLPKDMNAVIKGKYDLRSNAVRASRNNYNYTAATYTNNSKEYDDFEAGEHYLELSVTEERLVDLVCQNFEKVIVVINANNAMELGWVDNYAQIKAVLYAPGTGATGMTALGEILNGSVNPSAKTVDTFVKDLTATPTFNNFGFFPYTDSATRELRTAISQADPAYEGTISFVNYTDGIYVGYKFYETAAEEGLINYDDMVQYPFGYGLSFTTFEQKITAFEKTDSAVKVEVTVKNTGSVAGMSVVELYVTPPYTNGGIEKASVNLVDFAKTEKLEAGAEEVVTFEIPLEDMASYDSECIKTANGGYILEAGDYVMSIRSDSHTVLDSQSFNVAADIDYSTTGRSSDKRVANNVFEDYSKGPEGIIYLSRADKFANYAEATAAPAEALATMDADTLAYISANSSAHYLENLSQDPNAVMPTLGANNGLKLADLAGAAYDDARWDTLLDQMSAEDMVGLINVGGWQTVAVDSVGKMATSDCDGPAGLSNFITQNYGTAFPSEVLMAQTWSKDVAYELGLAMGTEYAEANNYGWYGPAMNTHRSAFAGRNFEYYSEDGVLAGKFAAIQVQGAAEKGVYAYIKHFAVNDQETSRCAFLMTHLTEQALREIYLKPFEIVVKNFDFNGNPLAVMSAFNFIGKKACCENPDLLITVLREEWGFVGMVETDYNGSYGYMDTESCIRNGGDLMLGFGMAATNQVDTTSATSVQAMRNACKNIMYTIANSGFYTTTAYAKAKLAEEEAAEAAVANAAATGMQVMTDLVNKVNLIGGGCLALIWLIVLIRWAMKKKAA